MSTAAAPFKDWDYGFERIANGDRRCLACGITFPKAKADGAVMRGHAKRCPIDPREYRVPARCDS